MTREKIVVACDLGGSVIDKVTKGSREKFLGPDYLLTRVVPQAFETLRFLAQETRGEDGKYNVYVVSACEAALRRKALWWLGHMEFSNRTCIPSENVLFCDSRGEKGAVYARLGVTHAIDDRIEVLSSVSAATKKFLFRPDMNEGAPPSLLEAHIHLAEDWPGIVRCILKDG